MKIIETSATNERTYFIFKRSIEIRIPIFRKNNRELSYEYYKNNSILMSLRFANTVENS